MDEQFVGGPASRECEHYLPGKRYSWPGYQLHLAGEPHRWRNSNLSMEYRQRRGNGWTGQQYCQHLVTERGKFNNIHKCLDTRNGKYHGRDWKYRLWWSKARRVV
ncbi:MAG: hypothetical protein WCJ37_17870 [Syntrophus sp. (in: bacteria)]